MGSLIGMACVTASMLSAALLSAALIAPAASHAQVLSHVPNLDRIAGDLFYPRASERFFLEGRQQLEREIQRQQQPQQPPALQINSEKPSQPNLELQEQNGEQRLEKP